MKHLEKNISAKLQSNNQLNISAIAGVVTGVVRLGVRNEKMVRKK